MPLPEWLKQGEQDEAQPKPRPKAGKDTAAKESKPLQPPPPAEPPPQEVQAEAEPQPSEPETPVPAPEAASAGETGQASAGDDVIAMLSAIEKQLAQLGDTQQRHAEQLASSSGPPSGNAEDDDRPTMADLEQREQELHAMRKRMEELEAQLQASSRESDDTEVLHKQLNEAQAEVEELVRQAEATHGELQQKTQQIEQAGRQLKTLQSQLDAAHQELEQARSAEPDTDRTVMSTETEVDEEQVVALNEQIARLEQELRQRDEEIQRLQSSAGAVSAEGGANPALLERQRQQIERLTEQLAGLQVDASPAEIRDRDARIAELEDEIEALRQQGGSKQGVSKLVAGLGGALSRGKKDKGPDASAISALEFRIEELTAERETLTDEVNQLRSRLESGGVVPGEDGAEVATLRARVAELESELEAAADGSDGVSDAAARKLRKELADAKADARQAEIDARQANELREQVQQLKQALNTRRRAPKDSIGASARHRTVVIFSCLVGMAIVAIVLSGVLANKIAPAMMSVSVNVEAKSRMGGTLTEEDHARWEAWHRAKLQDDAFHEQVARRLRDQRLDDFETAEAVTDRLESDLTIDSSRPGMLKLTLAGTDRGDLGTIMDTVVTTLAAESSHQAGKRSDNAIAVVRGERQEGGRIRYASLNPTPIKDRRLIVGSVFFVLCFVGGIFAMNKIYQGLRSTRQAMDEDPYEEIAGEV